jgi:GT2 family glycosyltransferase
VWAATLVSRRVVQAGVLPDPALFFGFEDFDFFCAIRDAGFSLLVDARSARRVMAYQTGAGRDEALGSQRPTDAEEPWRAYYVARNFFALARRHGRPAWIGWHLLYSGRRLQLATSGAERRAILSGLLHGALRRTGRNPRYLRVVGERPAPIPTSPTIVATSPETTAKELAGQCLALVVSHNAPGALARCLDAIVAQTVPPAGAVVVDNGSLPALAGDDLQRPGLAVAVVRSERNTGPAGGWALAFESFLRAGYRLAWVLDDDIVPDEDCLERILDGCAADPDRAFGFPRSIQPDGSVGEWGSWCGFVVARRIVEQVGVPRADLFWWAEDNEYTHWRIPKAGYPRRIVDGAVVQHDAVRHAAYVPTWKYYYEARNMLYLHLHLMRRVGWYPRNVATLIGRALLREKGRRLRSLAALGRGLVDGLVGRLGVRYPVEPMREQGTLDHAANEGVPTTAPPAEAVPA